MINPFKTKRGLGRGLSSLIGETKVEQKTAVIIEMGKKLRFIPLAMILRIYYLL